MAGAIEIRNISNKDLQMPNDPLPAGESIIVDYQDDGFATESGQVRMYNGELLIFTQNHEIEINMKTHVMTIHPR